MTAWVYRGLSRGVAGLPLGSALAFGRGLGWVFGSLIRYHRRDAREALKRSFPEMTPAAIEKIIRSMYSHLGMNIIESARMASLKDSYVKQHIRCTGTEIVEKVLSEGRGALALTAHVGNWEIASALLPRILGIKMSIVAKPIKGRGLDSYVRETRSRFGLQILSAKGSYRDCLRALRENQLIGFVLDQNMIRREGEFVEFFGRPACTTLGLAHLAARTGAPVIPIFARRYDTASHEIKIYPPLEPPRDKERESLIEATKKYTAFIEQVIRRHPEQWIWIHRRWRTTPLNLERAVETH